MPHGTPNAWQLAPAMSFSPRWRCAKRARCAEPPTSRHWAECASSCTRRSKHHVDCGQCIVRRQQTLIELKRNMDLPIELSEQFLDQFEQSQALFERLLGEIEREAH